MNFSIQLGNKVRDRVSGFEGTAVTRLMHLNGCLQYGIVAGVDKDGKMQDANYIDHQRLVVIDAHLADQFQPDATPGGQLNEMP